MSCGIIIGSAGVGAEIEILNKIIAENNPYIIAADGGMGVCLKEGIMPHEWIGDMDSSSGDFMDKVRECFPKTKVSTCSPIKDDTDMAIAANILHGKGCDVIHIFGGLGGNRGEHSIANIQLMHFYLLKDIRLIMYSENSKYYLLRRELRNYSDKERGYISVFSLTDKAEVKIKGFKYEYEGMMTNSEAIGVSNEFVGKDAYIHVSEGIALIIESGQ